MTDMPEWVLLDKDPDGGFSTFSANDDSQKYTRSDLVPTWNRDLSAAPAGESVILATSGGHVGEAIAPDQSDPDDGWFWAASGFTPLHPNHTPIAWQPLPRHPDEPPAAGSENGGGG